MFKKLNSSVEKTVFEGLCQYCISPSPPPSAAGRRGVRTVRQREGKHFFSDGTLLFVSLCLSWQLSEEGLSLPDIQSDSETTWRFTYQRERISGGLTRRKYLPVTGEDEGKPWDWSWGTRLMGRTTWEGCKHGSSISSQEVMDYI